MNTIYKLQRAAQLIKPVHELFIPALNTGDSEALGLIVNFGTIKTF